MMNKLAQISILFILFISSCYTSKPIKKENSSGIVLKSSSQIKVDIFKRIYILEGNELTKLSPYCDTLFNYTFPSVDEINDIDLLNPNEIVAFSESAQIIYILDNTLGLISSINLNETDLGLIIGVARTRDDLINVLSKDHKKLCKINDLGKISSMSDVLWNIDLSEVFDLTQIDNFIAIRSKESNSVWLYDEFGTLHTRLLDVRTNFKLQAYKGLLCYLNDRNQLVFKNLERLVDEDQYVSIDVRQSDISSFFLYEDYIYLLMKTGEIRKEIIQS